MPKVTITDVAAHAAVSRATADRVLNRRGGVSVRKERAVLESARLLGLDRNFDAAQAKLLRVCVLMKPPPNPYYERLARCFRAANQNFAPQAITAYVSHIDVLAPDKIQSQLGRIARNYDALIVVAPTRQNIIVALRDIATRVPVITLATDLPLGTPHHYVGPSNHQAGRLAGELMGRMFGGAGGKILLIAGLNEFSGHRERRDGFAELLAESYPACSIGAEIESFDLEDGAADMIVTVLAETPEIRGIYNISQGNDEITRRLKTRGMAHRFTFIGHDLTETTRRLLLARHIDAVIDQDPMLEARRAMEIVLQHYGRWGGEAIDGRTPLRVFFRENAAGEFL